MSNSLMHTKCLLCGKHAVSVPWHLEGLPYENYSYCPDCIHKAMKLLRFIGFIFLFIACGTVFSYLLNDDTESYTRLMMHEFYRQDTIDILFIGSSHCYISLDPRITDEIFQANTFNAGSALQAQDASFALIREAVERYNVRQVYMEM